MYKDMKAKLVNEAIKHLSGFSEEEAEANFLKDLAQFKIDPTRPFAAHGYIDKVGKYVLGVDENKLTYNDYREIVGSILYNLDEKALKDATTQTINDYLFG